MHAALDEQTRIVRRAMEAMSRVGAKDEKRTRPMRIERLNSIRRRRSEEVLCTRK